MTFESVGRILDGLVITIAQPWPFYSYIFLALCGLFIAWLMMTQPRIRTVTK